MGLLSTTLKSRAAATAAVTRSAPLAVAVATGAAAAAYFRMERNKAWSRNWRRSKVDEVGEGLASKSEFVGGGGSVFGRSSQRGLSTRNPAPPPIDTAAAADSALDLFLTARLAAPVCGSFPARVAAVVSAVVGGLMNLVQCACSFAASRFAMASASGKPSGMTFCNVMRPKERGEARCSKQQHQQQQQQHATKQATKTIKICAEERGDYYE
mmetsp:Transcript_21379/g.36023  ORF Transcript_21379/g.36023 Transcript_21379/m.36023 type:complete len:212 (+) Transcript_21379:611-1246(+)